MSDTDARLQRLLGGDALADLRARLRRRLERSAGLAPFTLAALATHEREALENLLGRPPRNADSMRVSVAEFDAALAPVAPSLRGALELLDGPLSDAHARRLQRAHDWGAALAQIDAATATPPALLAWLHDSRNRGLLRRVCNSDAVRAPGLIADVARVLAQLPAGGTTRSRLAAGVLGDAHALDDGRPAATLLLSFLARRGDDEEPDERSRAVWARQGVLVNELARPVLALNLPTAGTGALARCVQLAAAHGDPLHLSLRALLREVMDWRVAGLCVSVCENPDVVVAAADRLGAAASPLICTDGMPAAAQRTLLAQLCAAGATLRYHCDFDWGGLRIGQWLQREFGARPWRYAAVDYRASATSGPALGDVLIDAAWDPVLLDAMREVGRAVHEEAVVDDLLADLATPIRR